MTTAKRILAALSIVSALLGLGSLSTGTARADSSDDDAEYVSLLRSHGLKVRSVEQARAGGLAVCEALEAGQSIDHVTTEVMQSNAATWDEARIAVIDASVVYCPGQV